MTVDEGLERILRSALPPVAAAKPSRDLWPILVDRSARRRIAWIDFAVAAVTVVALLLFPDWLWLLAYHL